MEGRLTGRRLLVLLLIGGLPGLSLVTWRLLLDVAGEPSPFLIFAAEVAILSLVGLTAFLLVARRGPRTVDEGGVQTPSENDGETKRTGVLLAATLFVLTLTLAVRALWRSLYVPSPTYYLFLSLSLTFLGMEVILSRKPSAPRTVGILLQTVAVGIVVQISYPLLNPGSVFSDMYFDWLGIISIQATGQVPESLGYFYYFPAYHVLNAISMNVASWGVSTYGMANHLLMVLAVPAAYLFTRELFSRQVALLTSLLIVISLFFFLSVSVLPALLGVNLLLLTGYVLLRHTKRPGRGWWMSLWLLALFVFLSHPVNALILAVVLIVFWLVYVRPGGFRSTIRSPTPTGTYCVGYFAYLVFIALNTLTIFLQSLTGSGPEVHFARIAAPSVPLRFQAQAVASTLGFAILFAPGTFALLALLSTGNRSGNFLLGVAAVLVAVPAVMVLTGRGAFGLQAARTLLYLSIFLPPVAAVGLIRAANAFRRPVTRAVLMGSIVLVASLFSTTSYLTGSGNRFLSDSIPVQTSFVTDSMLEVRWFLQEVPVSTPIALDPYLATFMAPSNSPFAYPFTPYPLEEQSVHPFGQGLGNDTFVLALSDTYLSGAGYQSSEITAATQLHPVLVYDSGMVRVFYPSGSSAEPASGLERS